MDREGWVWLPLYGGPLHLHLVVVVGCGRRLNRLVTVYLSVKLHEYGAEDEK